MQFVFVPRREHIYTCSYLFRRFLFPFHSFSLHFLQYNMMANPVSFQPGDDVKVVYLYKKPTINNMIGTVVTHVRDQANMVEVVVDRRCYGIHPSNLVSIPLIIDKAYRTIALRILSTGCQLASRKRRFFDQTLDIIIRYDAKKRCR